MLIFVHSLTSFWSTEQWDLVNDCDYFEKKTKFKKTYT